MTYLDMWRSGTFLLYGCKVAFCIQETSPRLSDVKYSVVLWSLFVISSALTCCFSRIRCHSSTSPGTFCQAFPYVSTTSEKCWDEKAWVRAYRDRSCLLASFKVQNLESNSKYCPCKLYAQLSKQQDWVSCLKC